MRKIDYSVITAILLYFISEIATGGDLVISDKESTANHTINNHTINFPGLLINLPGNNRKKTVVRFSGKNKDRIKFKDIYLRREGLEIRLNDFEDADHIIKKLNKLINTRDNYSQQQYYSQQHCQSASNCKSFGHAYYMLMELYPPGTDFQTLYDSMYNESVIDFAYESHIIGEIFSLQVQPVASEDEHILNFILFHLGQNIYVLISDHSMSVLSKKALIEFIINSNNNPCTVDIKMSISRSIIRPTAFSLIDYYIESLTQLLMNPYFLLIKKIFFIATAFGIYQYQKRSRSDDTEERDTDSEDSSENDSDNHIVDSMLRKKPENHVTRRHFQDHETVVVTPESKEKTHSSSQQSHKPKVTDTDFLTEEEIEKRVAELQEAYREGEGQQAHEKNLLITLKNIFTTLRKSEDITRVVEHNPRIYKLVKATLRKLENLELSDQTVETLKKKVVRRIR